MQRQQYLQLTMRPNICPRCKDKFYDFPKSKQDHAATRCIICKFYTYNLNRNAVEKMYLEQN
jgi:hypothetical protein